MGSRLICASLTFTAVNSQNRVRVQTACSRVIVKEEGAGEGCVACARPAESALAKPQTNTGNEGRMDLIVEFQTRAHQRPHGLGSDWSLFIHKSWKEKHARRAYGSVSVPPTPKRVHMVALLSNGRLTSSGRAAALVALFSDGGIWLREEEHGTILRAPAHMEAITSKACSSATLPQLKWNHRNPRGSLPSLLSPLFASALPLLDPGGQRRTVLLSAQPSS